EGTKPDGSPLKQFRITWAKSPISTTAESTLAPYGFLTNEMTVHFLLTYSSIFLRLASKSANFVPPLAASAPNQRMVRASPTVNAAFKTSLTFLGTQASIACCSPELTPPSYRI